MCEFCLQDTHLPGCPYAADPSWECVFCGESVDYKMDGVPLHEECEFAFYSFVAAEHAEEYLDKMENPEIYYHTWWFNNLPPEDRLRLLRQMYAAEEAVFPSRMADDRMDFVREQEDACEFGKEVYDRLL